MEKFKHKKSLGQNFLHDQNIITKISQAIKLNENDLVIEIGPGQGALTKKLQEYNINLICYEVDERTKPYLERIKKEKTIIKYQDFLTANILGDIKNYKYDNLYIIANLPYYITTPIIKKIIADKIPVKSMVLMVQNEVADRFNARPKSKNYNSLTIFLNYYFSISKLFIVKSNCFNPAPKVDSAVVKFEIRENRPEINNEEKFFKLVKDAFQQKRKTLKNNLKDYDWQKIKTVLDKHSLSTAVRAEELTEEIFIEIFQSL